MRALRRYLDRIEPLFTRGGRFERYNALYEMVDTLLYTLSGRANQEQGWGLEGESWRTMDALEELGGETWFRLGDRDMATHLWRSERLRSGERLGAVTSQLARRLGIRAGIHPMSDDPVRTIVHSEEGDLPFQHYFVRRRFVAAQDHTLDLLELVHEAFLVL